MAFPRSRLKFFVPYTLRIATTSGAKGPVAPLFPMVTAFLRGTEETE